MKENLLLEEQDINDVYNFINKKSEYISEEGKIPWNTMWAVMGGEDIDKVKLIMKDERRKISGTG